MKNTIVEDEPRWKDMTDCYKSLLDWIRRAASSWKLEPAKVDVQPQVREFQR